MRTDAGWCAEHPVTDMTLSFTIAEDATSLLQRATREFLLPICIGGSSKGTAGTLLLQGSARHGYQREVVIVPIPTYWIVQSTVSIWMIQFFKDRYFSITVCQVFRDNLYLRY